MIQIIMPKTFISNYGIFQKIASIKNTSISSISSLIKTNIPVYHRSTIKNRKNRHNLQNLQSRQNLLHKYKSIKKKESSKPTENKNNLVQVNNINQIIPQTPTPQPHQQQPYPPTSPPQTKPSMIRCQGCNVILQSSDKKKYGYITQKILNDAITQNISKIHQTYGVKLTKSKDAKILDIMHQVQKQTGIKIFNEQNNQIQNLDNLQVLLLLQQKIDKYQQQQQLTIRQNKIRSQILCYRCFSLKYHNRLPQQYDNNLQFTTDTTQYILNKIFNRNKYQPLSYFFLIDALDVLGTFQQWLFTKLISQQLNIVLIVNKIDIINKLYFNETLLHADIKKKLNKFLLNIYGNQKQAKQKLTTIKIFYISCTSSDGIKKLFKYIQQSNNNIQLLGYPNTGKTTLLNILSRINKSISKIPGTTLKITQNNYTRNKKIKIYDMPGLYSSNLLYNLIEKPSIKALLTWHKKIAPGLLTNYAFIYGGKLEINDTRIIVFGHGGACSSTNKWFIQNYQQFWIGLPSLSSLKIKKYQIQMEFINGKAQDLQIAGYGFIGFRLCIPNIKKTTRKLILYLPQQVLFQFRQSVLSTNDSIFHNKNALKKKYMLQRLTIISRVQRKKILKQKLKFKKNNIISHSNTYKFNQQISSEDQNQLQQQREGQEGEYVQEQVGESLQQKINS